MEPPAEIDSGDGPIAQLAEHRADNAGVSGAIPLRPTISLSLNDGEMILRREAPKDHNMKHCSLSEPLDR